MKTEFGVRFIIKGNFIVYADNEWKTKLTILDTKGTLTDKSDDDVKIISTFVDQDGKSIDIGYIFNIVEDKMVKFG